MSNEVRPEELKEVFRANMKARRQAIGLTQVQLSERLGVFQPYISALESGRKSPLMETLAEIAEALDTTPAKLLTPKRARRAAS